MVATDPFARATESLDPAPASLPAARTGRRRPRPTARVNSALLPAALVALASLAPLAARAQSAAPGRTLLAALVATTLFAAVTGRRDSSRLGLALSVSLAAWALPWQLSWWPLPGAYGVAVYVLTCLPGRTTTRHRRRAISVLGRLGVGEVWAILGLVSVSAVSLLLFYQQAPPRLGEAAGILAALSPMELTLVGLAFALLNAFVEEVLFRGVILHHLAPALGVWTAVLVQAVAFGMLHLDGYPHGPAGVGLTFGYALLLGALRVRSDGLLAVWIAHVCADLMIFVLIAHSLT